MLYTVKLFFSTPFTGCHAYSWTHWKKLKSVLIRNTTYYVIVGWPTLFFFFHWQMIICLSTTISSDMVTSPCTWVISALFEILLWMYSSGQMWFYLWNLICMMTWRPFVYYQQKGKFSTWILSIARSCRNNIQLISTIHWSEVYAQSIVIIFWHCVPQLPMMSSCAFWWFTGVHAFWPVTIEALSTSLINWLSTSNNDVLYFPIVIFFIVSSWLTFYLSYSWEYCFGISCSFCALH